MTALAPFHQLWCCLYVPQKLQLLGVGRAPVSLGQSPVGVGKVTQSPPS